MKMKMLLGLISGFFAAAGLSGTAQAGQALQPSTLPPAPPVNPVTSLR